MDVEGISVAGARDFGPSVGMRVVVGKTCPGSLVGEVDCSVCSHDVEGQESDKIMQYSEDLSQT